MTACSDTFLQEEIDFTKQLLDAYKVAILALTAGGAQSYTLDTGQTKQTVTKFDIDKLNTMINSLRNDYLMLCTRKNGGNTVSIGMAW